jgi:cation transport ATPase
MHIILSHLIPSLTVHCTCDHYSHLTAVTLAAYLSALHGSFGMDALVVTGTTIAFTYSSIQLAASCISGVPTMHVFFETSGMLLLFVTMWVRLYRL